MAVKVAGGYKAFSVPYSSWGGAPPPSPDRLFVFDGLSDGADVSGVFSYWGMKGSAYGTQATTATPPPNKTSSALMTIAQGSDGLRQSATHGTFGGGLSADPSWVLGEGDELYTGLWIRVPNGFDFSTNTLSLKFFRPTFDSKTSKLEFQIYHNLGANQVGWRVFHEAHPQAVENDARETSVVLTPDTWEFLTFYIKFSSVAADSIVRISKNNEFAYERNGTSLKYRNSLGNIQTDTVLGLPTLEDAATTFSGAMLFTYWNGGNATNTGTHPAQDQGLQIGNIGYQLSTPSLTDDQGNPILDGSVF